MPKEEDLDRWARLRFAIIGPLLAAPPKAGALRQALQALASKSWTHPVNGTAVNFSFATVERWYYAARQATDPVRNSVVLSKTHPVQIADHEACVDNRRYAVRHHSANIRPTEPQWRSPHRSGTETDRTWHL